MNKILLYVNVGSAIANISFLAAGAGNAVTVLSLALNCLAIYLLRKAR